MIWNEGIECASREKIEAIQLERLKSTVENCYNNVPHYKKKLDAAGVKLGDIKTLADITKIPFTEKDDLRDNYPYKLFAVPMKDVVRIHASSGTTGKPKGAVHTHCGFPVKAAQDMAFGTDVHAGDVVYWMTDMGWMMGPWLIYATLINRGCIALFEGLPSGPFFAEFVERAGVTMLGVVPSLVRAWRDSGACEKADWTGIRVFSSTGEPSNRADYMWLMSRAGYQAPVIEYCGGTEIGEGATQGFVN